jgi:hypothetical protein
MKDSLAIQEEEPADCIQLACLKRAHPSRSMPLLQLEYKVGRVSSATFGTHELAIHINFKGPRLLQPQPFACRINVATKWGRTAWWTVDVLDIVARFHRLRVHLQPTSRFFVNGGFEIDRDVVWENYSNILVVCQSFREVKE